MAARSIRRRARSIGAKEQKIAKLARKAEKASRFRRGRPVEQFPSAFPDAPEIAAGIGRTLSRGLP